MTWRHHASPSCPQVPLWGHSQPVTSVEFSPDGRRIVSGSHDKTLKIWDAETGQQTLSLSGHTNAVTSVAFSLDGRRIVSGSWDQTLKVWDATTRPLDGHTPPLRIPPGTQSGGILTLRGLGVPRLNGRGRGDEQFLFDCYRVFLGREPDTAERLGWLGGVWNHGRCLKRLPG